MARNWAGFGLVVLGLCACSDAEIEPEPSPRFPAITVTLAADVGRVEGPVAALALAQNLTQPWRGVVFAAPQSGGLTAFDLEGGLRGQAAGPALSDLAVSPEFIFRDTPAVLAVGIQTEDGGLRAYLLAEGGLYPAPLAYDAPLSPLAAICTLDSDLAGLTVLALNRDGSAQIWRISDVGEDALLVEPVEPSFRTRARDCAGVGRDKGVLALAEGSLGVWSQGLGAKLTDGAATVERLAGTRFSDNREVFALTDAGLNMVWPETGEFRASVTLEPGFGVSTEGSVTAIAANGANFGGAGFSAGVVAVGYGDGAVAVTALDAVSRALSAAVAS
ncbi:MAG: hypothetical protein ACFB2Z_12350 [Maricaulaceae bacterium]